MHTASRLLSIVPMTLLLAELFSHQESDVMIPELVKVTCTYHQNYKILLNII